MKIIIIDHEPYTKRRAEHFFESSFKQDGFEFEFWSIWKLLNYSKNLEYSCFEEAEHVSYIRSWKELKLKLRQLNNNDTFIFIECWFNSYSWKLFLWLKRGGLKWSKLDYYNNPTSNFYFGDQSYTVKPIEVKDIRIKILNVFKEIQNLDYLIFHLIKKFRFQLLKELMRPKIIFQTGEYINNEDSLIQYVPINYFDVELFNNSKNESPILTYPYLVFADIFLGKHPDLEIHHGKNYLNVELYYNFLNSFFKRLESQLGMPVVIAAHPKSNYTSEFGNRIVIKNKTANLVINSQVFIHHGSLSISFALLSHKPIIQFYNDTFNHVSALNNFIKVMNNLERQLGISTVNVSELSFEDKIVINKPEVIRYENVIRKYFKGNELNNYAVVKRNILGFF